LFKLLPEFSVSTPELCGVLELRKLGTGHMMPPYLEITWLGNRLFITAMEARAVVLH
jgi:hypothetical protein